MPKKKPKPKPKPFNPFGGFTNTARQDALTDMGLIPDKPKPKPKKKKKK